MRVRGWMALVLLGCAGGTTDEPTDDTEVGGETDDGVDDTDPTGVDDTDAGDDSDVAAACGPAATFLDLSGAPGPGAAYDAPSVEVACGADTWTVHTNAMIGYTFVQTTPNALTAGDYTWEIPLRPEVAEATSDIPLLGFVAVAVNGIPIFGPNEAGTPAESAWGDPVYNGIMDPCMGHTAFVYHYHALLQKCLTQAAAATSTPWTLPDPDGSSPSPVVAWSADGFPIYGPYECADAGCGSVVELKSGWSKTGDPKKNAWDAYTWSASADPAKLDRCNGHVGPGGDYHYHATSGFPYVLGCYAGTAIDGGLPGGGGPGGGGNGGPP